MRSSTAPTTPIGSTSRWQPSRFDLHQRNLVTPANGAPARRQSPPALSRPGVRVWRRRHPAARRGSAQARRARDAPQAPRFRPLCPARRPDRGRCAGRSAASSRLVDAAAQRDHRPAQLDALRSCSASRSRRARKPPQHARRSCRFFGDRRARRRRSHPPSDRRREGEGDPRRDLRQCRQDAVPALRVDGGLNFEFSHLTVTRRCERGPPAEVLQAQPIARLEFRHRMARAAFRPPQGRAARLLRLHQRRRPFRADGSTAAMRSSSRSGHGNCARPSIIRSSATGC